MKLKVSNNESYIAAILAVIFFVILFVGSLFEHRYSIPMRYVSYGLPVLFLMGTVGIHQIGNFTITITNENFTFKSLLKNRAIPLSKIQGVTLHDKNSIKDIIVKIDVRNSIDFRFNRYYIKDEDFEELLKVLHQYIK